VKPGGEAEVVADALARSEGSPLVVVAEKWVAHGAFGGSRTMGGLGAQWGRWDGAIRGARVPTSHVVRVVPQRWQAATIPYRVGQDRAERLRLVEQRAGLIKPGAVRDEAAAILIGRWASESHEIVAALDIAEGKHLGIDVHAARARLSAEKTKRRETKARRAQRSKAA
jgi:hypothetical protein